MCHLLRIVFFVFIACSPLNVSAQTDTVETKPPPPTVHQAPNDPSNLFPASQIPIEEPADKFTSELYNMLITLGILIGAIIALSWFLKRLLNAKVQQDNVSSNIKVIERRTLSPKSGIYLLEVYDKTLVVAESPAGFQHLATIDMVSETTEETPKTQFAQILDKRKPEKE